MSSSSTAVNPISVDLLEDFILLPSFREICKHGWLNRCCTDAERRWKKADRMGREEKLWVVFCVHDGTDPYLESYECQKKSLAHEPLAKWSLKRCAHVSANIPVRSDDHHFTVTLTEENVVLSAPTRDVMLEWIEVIRAKLRELGILQARENIYSKEPETKYPLAPVRDPTSPLPLPPHRAATPPGMIRDPRLHSPPPEAGVVVSLSVALPPTPLTLVEMTDYEVQSDTFRAPLSAPVSSLQDAELFDFSLGSVPRVEERPRYASVDADDLEHRSSRLRIDDDWDDANNSRLLYEPLFLAQTALETSQEDLDAITPEDESVSLPVAAQDRLSLKQVQVIELQKQIAHPDGVRLRIHLEDCKGSIAFVDVLGSAWIAGWKQREHPFLYNNFHIGDRIISIGHRRINCARDAQRAVKESYSPSVEFVVARLPFGHAFALRRDYDGQSLGFEQEENTAEIRNVDPEGLAARHGLTAKVHSPTGNCLCNWTITEINGRPLNLFFKNGEVHGRLQAVGRDISLLVQPVEFIRALRKQLKSLRSYKDYIVQ